MSKTIDKAGSLFLRAVLLRMKELGLNKTALAARPLTDLRTRKRVSEAEGAIG